MLTTEQARARVEKPKVYNLNHCYLESDLQILADCIEDRRKALLSEAVYCPTESPQQKELCRKNSALEFFLYDLKKLGITPGGAK